MQHPKAPRPTAEEILFACLCRELTVEDDVAIVQPVELWECDTIIRRYRIDESVILQIHPTNRTTLGNSTVEGRMKRNAKGIPGALPGAPPALPMTGLVHVSGQ